MNINLREANHLYWKLRDWQRATELADESRSDDDYAYEEEAWTALESTFTALGYRRRRIKNSSTARGPVRCPRRFIRR